MPEKLAMIQLELALPQVCRNHIRSWKPKTGTELVSEIESFITSRNSSWDDVRWNQKSGSGDTRWQQKKLFTSKEYETPKAKGPAEGSVLTQKLPGSTSWSKMQDKDKRNRLESFVCHKLGHFASECPQKSVEIHHVDVGQSTLPMPKWEANQLQ
jgi:hypothetical protein